MPAVRATLSDNFDVEASILKVGDPLCIGVIKAFPVSIRGGPSTLGSCRWHLNDCIQRHIRHLALQLGVLVPMRPQPLGIGQIHPALLGRLPVKRRGVKAMPAAQLGCRKSCLLLFDQPDRQHFGEPAFPHVVFSLGGSADTTLDLGNVRGARSCPTCRRLRFRLRLGSASRRSGSAPRLRRTPRWRRRWSPGVGAGGSVLEASRSAGWIAGLR